MNKQVKILLILLFFIVGVAVLVHWQARRIVIELVKANASERVDVKIGRLQIIPHKSSIRLKDISVRIRDKEANGYTNTSIRNAFLDVASLWEFFQGGILVIEKLVCDGGELTIRKGTTENMDSSQHVSQNLIGIFEKLKKDAIRFRIQEMEFRDFNFIMIHDSTQYPIEIKGLQFSAHHLYLSADSILKEKALVKFSLPGQRIHLPDGINLTFDTLHFSTTDNSIQVDALEIQSSTADSINQYKIYSEKVRLSHIDFETLYTQGISVIDSVFLGRSSFDLQMRLGKNDTSKKSFEYQSLPKLNIRHVIINDLAADIKLRQDSLENRFKIDNSFITIQDLWHKPDSSHKISTRNFDMVIAKYSTFLSKNSTSISFDTVRLQKYGLSLLNFKLITSDQKLPILQTSVFELKQIDWYALLIDRKLVAEEAIILNPTVRTAIKPASISKDGSEHKLALNSLQDFLQVELFSLKNATAYLEFVSQQAKVVVLGGNATLHFDDIIRSASPNQAIQSFDNFSFNMMRVNSQSLSAQMDQFSFLNGATKFGNMTLMASEKINLSMSGFKLNKIDWDEIARKLNLNGVGWRTLKVSIIENTDSTKSSKINLPFIYIKKLKGADSQIEFSVSNTRFGTLIQQISLESLELGDNLRISGIDITGRSANFQSGPQSGTINYFSFSDQHGELSDIRLNRMAADTLHASIDRISFNMNVQALTQKKISVSNLDLLRMRLSYSKRDSMQQLKIDLENDIYLKSLFFENKKLTIDSLKLETNLIDVKHDRKITKGEELTGSKPKFNFRRLNTGFDSLLHLRDSSKNIKTSIIPGKRTFNDAVNPLYTIKSTSLQSRSMGMRMSFSGIEADLDSSLLMKSKVNYVQFKDVHLNTNDLQAQVASGSIKALVINSDHLHAPWLLIGDNYPTAAIHNLKARLETDGNFIQFDRLDYDPFLTRGHIQGFEFRPIKDRQAFLDDSFYQTNFMHVKIPALTFDKFHASKLANDTIFHLGSVRVSAPDLEVQRDKTHPFFSNKVKLLPTNAIQQVGMKFRIDTLRVENGIIHYIEKSRITEQEGSIHFSDLNGLVRNFRNIELQDHDSLSILASTRFLDSALVTLRVKESYRDTLAGFLMTTQVSPFHTSILNPALIPLVSVEFQSGFVDTLQMRAIGREYMALGSMRFLYRDLKVNFLNSNDTSRHSVKNAIMKFAANNFVVRSNNTKRLGKVYFERDRQRAVFQYWVKMILSGVTTSVGTKSNKKQIRKYMKELNQKKLPPIDENSSL